MAKRSFSGFPKEALQFFDQLAINNTKTWFDQHKSDYETFVMAPAREFVLALGEQLRQLSPHVVADPRVNKSIFRIYRDTRFSQDKTPYKTNLALWFPVGDEGAKFEKPGYYVHLESQNLMLGVGIYRFSPQLLKAYRDAVIEMELGSQLVGLMAKLTKKGYGVGEKIFKRPPRGYNSDHPFVELLLYGGLTAGIDLGIPQEFHTPELVDLCFEIFIDLSPVVFWLEAMIHKNI